MKIIKSGTLGKHEDVEYLYIFHDLASHKDKADIRYAISKTYYFLLNEKFYKQHEMLQEGLDAKDFKDESSVLDHIGKLNKEQLSSTQKKRAELKVIQASAVASSTISDLIAFHDEVIAVLLEWFNRHEITISPKKESGSIPDYLSKWGKEVVKYLLINGETKNADIIDYLRTGLKMDTSYDHLSAIFKTEKSRAFYREELVKDGSYFSLKDPNKFQ